MSNNEKIRINEKKQSYGTLKFDQITALCYFLRINHEYVLKFEYFDMYQRTKLLTNFINKQYVKSQGIMIRNEGVIAPYLI